MKHDNELPPQGIALRDALGKYGWTQSELALRTGYSQKHISGIISGARTITPYAAVVIGHWLPSITAEKLLEAQIEHQVSLARERFNPVAEAGALQQPAMFDIEL